jgi:hypothetical protein
MENQGPPPHASLYYYYYCNKLKKTRMDTSFSPSTQTKLYGAIMHGEFSGAFLYPDYMEGGSNCVIEVIHRMITSYQRGDPSTGRPPKKLPPSLYLQLDNTVK